MIRTLLLTGLSLLALTMPAAAGHPNGFTQAKKAMRNIYQGHQTSFYCGCDYSYTGNKGVPDFRTCGYQPRKPLTNSGKRNARIDRIEWEHVVPAWAFGHQLQCWQSGGRKNCGRTSQKFKTMESDMHNLTPALGEVNGDRANFKFVMLQDVPARHGRCDVRVNFREKKFMPPRDKRGDIARTYFYMRDRYGYQIARQQRQLFEAWSRQDPVDNWERERERRIHRAQGNGNSYVSGQGRVERAPGFGGRQGNNNQGGGQGGQCDARKTKCSQMRDCAEAVRYLNQCNRRGFDRDGDGVPCQSLCKNWCAPHKTKCSQMKNCKEAKFYLNRCGRKGFDRNKDGVPCEAICKKKK